MSDSSDLRTPFPFEVGKVYIFASWGYPELDHDPGPSQLAMSVAPDECLHDNEYDEENGIVPIGCDCWAIPEVACIRLFDAFTVLDIGGLDRDQVKVLLSNGLQGWLSAYMIATEAS